MCGLVPRLGNHQSVEKRCVPERSLSDGVTMYETTVDPLSVPLVTCVVCGWHESRMIQEISANTHKVHMKKLRKERKKHKEIQSTSLAPCNAQMKCVGL